MPDVYIKGADLPDLTRRWEDHNHNLIDFSTGWTFTALIGKIGQPAVIEKTSGMTGAATEPNFTLAWELDELDDLEPNQAYTIDVTAVRASDGKERKMQLSIFVKDSVREPSP